MRVVQTRRMVPDRAAAVDRERRAAPALPARGDDGLLPGGAGALGGDRRAQPTLPENPGALRAVQGRPAALVPRIRGQLRDFDGAPHAVAALTRQWTPPEPGPASDAAGLARPEAVGR